MTDGSAEPMRFSVIVCSWQRPTWLKRCLVSLRQLDYPEFEVIVVADPTSLGNIDTSGLKTVPFYEPNLSLARNAGIAASGGDVCAFIDDDSVAEPMWLAHLAAGLTATGAAAAVGYVRGRNGISFQSKVTSIDCEAETHVEPDAGLEPVVPGLPQGRSLKLVGTNMAVCRSVFGQLGGFDPAYRYFLEDADLSIRISQAGLATCVTPAAQVHHAFASSSRRTRLRTPLSLFDIGRSTALFLRRFVPEMADQIRERVTVRERNRLLRHMVLGACEPRDIDRLLQTLNEGWRDGMSAPLLDHEAIVETVEFQRVDPLPSGHIVKTSRFFLNRRQAVRDAIEIAKTGQRVSLFSFSLTPIRHHLLYTSDGVWLQTGGLFGRSDRNQPLFKWCRFAERYNEESGRVAIARGLRE